MKTKIMDVIGFIGLGLLVLFPFWFEHVLIAYYKL